MAYLGNAPGVESQRLTTAFTATDGQTAFNPVGGYTLGYVDAYLNGVKLIDGTDYTADDGVTVTLTTGAALNDNVELVTYTPRGLSDGYTKTEADGRYVQPNDDVTFGDVTVDAFTSTGIDDNSTSTAITINSSDIVGIGTASPAANSKLHAKGSSTYDGKIIADNSSDTGSGIFSVYQNGTSRGFIGTSGSALGDTSSDMAMFSNSGIRLFTGNSTEKARIDSSGNLLVGTTASAGVGVGDTNTGHVFGEGGWVTHSRSNNTTLYVNRNTSDGTIIDLRKDGSTVGSIKSRAGLVTTLILDPRSTGAGITGGGVYIYPTNNTGSLTDGVCSLGIGANRFKDLYLSGSITSGANGGLIKEIGGDTSLVQGAVGLRVNDSASALSPTTGSANNDAAVDLGVSNIRFKDLYLSGGVYLGGTGSEHKLDYYEEGVWTPTVYRSSGASTLTYSSQIGKYTRVGNMVYIEFQIGVDSVTSQASGYTLIGGLPFSSASAAGYTNIMQTQGSCFSSSDAITRAYASSASLYIGIDENGGFPPKQVAIQVGTQRGCGVFYV